MISYEELRRIQNAERDNKSLQRIDDAFFEQVKEYVKSKHKMLEENKDNDNVFAKETFEKNAQELKNINKILKDICSRRQRKIIMQALTNITAKIHNTEKMLPEEEELYNEIVSQLKGNIECFFSKFEDSEEGLKKGDVNLKLIRITEEIPAFVWTDNTNYGPFAKEDVVNLPIEVGEILIKEGKAIEIVVDQK